MPSSRNPSELLWSTASQAGHDVHCQPAWLDLANVQHGSCRETGSQVRRDKWNSHSWGGQETGFQDPLGTTSRRTLGRTIYEKHSKGEGERGFFQAKAAGKLCCIHKAEGHVAGLHVEPLPYWAPCAGWGVLPLPSGTQTQQRVCSLALLKDNSSHSGF